jgi:hypothetical protein
LLLSMSRYSYSVKRREKLQNARIRNADKVLRFPFEPDDFLHRTVLQFSSEYSDSPA